MTSVMLSAFSDAWQIMKDFFNQSIGTAGITVVVCILSVVGLLLFWHLCKSAIGKTKVVIKWWTLILLVVDVILLVYFCLMY